MNIKVTIIGWGCCKSNTFNTVEPFEKSIRGAYCLGGTSSPFHSFGRNFISDSITSLIKTAELSLHDSYLNILDIFVNRIFTKAITWVGSIFDFYSSCNLYCEHTDDIEFTKTNKEYTYQRYENSKSCFYSFEFLQKKTYSKTFLMLYFYIILLSQILFKQRAFIKEKTINIFMLLMLYLLTYRHAVFKTKKLRIKTFFVNTDDIRSCCFHGGFLGFFMENSCNSSCISMGCS